MDSYTRKPRQKSPCGDGHDYREVRQFTETKEKEYKYSTCDDIKDFSSSSDAYEMVNWRVETGTKVYKRRCTEWKCSVCGKVSSTPDTDWEYVEG